MKPGVTLQDLKEAAKKYGASDEEYQVLLMRIPPSWTMHSCRTVEGAESVYFTRGSIQVILSLGRYEDGQLWIHVSACGRTGAKSFYLPSWEEMKRVKHDFIGEDAWAYQIFPSAREYVNDNPYVLHLFARFDGQSALPDFTHGLGTL